MSHKRGKLQIMAAVLAVAFAAALLVCGTAGATVSAPRVQFSLVNGLHEHANLTWRFRGIPFCTGNEMQSVLELRLWQGTRTVLNTSSDACRFDTYNKLGKVPALPKGWTDPGSSIFDSSGGEAIFGFMILWPNHNRAGVYRYSWTTLWYGRAIRSGRFAIHVSEIPRRRIYEGTDAFQNYCKNKKKTIYSLNSKLYCISLRNTYYRFT